MNENQESAKKLKEDMVEMKLDLKKTLDSIFLKIGADFDMPLFDNENGNWSDAD